MEKHKIQFLLFENVPNRNKLLIVQFYIFFFVNVNGGFVVEIIETKMTECVYHTVVMTAYYRSLILNIKKKKKILRTSTREIQSRI